MQQACRGQRDSGCDRAFTLAVHLLRSKQHGYKSRLTYILLCIVQDCCKHCRQCQYEQLKRPYVQALIFRLSNFRSCCLQRSKMPPCAHHWLYLSQSWQIWPGVSATWHSTGHFSMAKFIKTSISAQCRHRIPAKSAEHPHAVD